MPLELVGSPKLAQGQRPRLRELPLPQSSEQAADAGRCDRIRVRMARLQQAQALRMRPAPAASQLLVATSAKMAHPGQLANVELK